MDLITMATDPAKETAGVWVDLGPTSKVKVKRAGNPEFRKCLKDLMAPYELSMQHTPIPEETAEKFMAIARGTHVLVDWQGLELEGKKLTYTAELSTSLFMDKRLKEFQEFILNASASADNFRISKEEAAIKN